jgi:uncharacterized protein YwqG
MAKKQSIAFVEVTSPISGLVTKFGGQPAWLAGAEWPISRATGEPMRFICQIAVDPDLFGNMGGRMAYLFISDGLTFVDNTWDPEGGENAVIIQPGAGFLPTQPLQTGPSLYKMVDDSSTNRRNPIACEFDVILQPGEDRDALDEDESAAAAEIENKIGGTPAFLQFSEWPSAGPWRLLLQLDSAKMPFEVNFGDSGVGYAFIAEDGQTGKFLWQCV